MRARTLAATAALLLAAPLALAAPAPAGKAGEGGPPVVLQVAPLGKVIDDLKAAARAVAGDAAADHITQAIAGKLGEKGFAGIDTKKPIAAYLYIPDKLDIAGKKPADIDPGEVARKFKGAVVVPVTTEGEFKDFFGRLTDNKAKFEPVDGKDGLYKVENPDHPAPFPVRARFHAGHAYIGLNMADDDMDPKSLVGADALVDPREPGVIAVKAFTDRYPPGLMKESMDNIDAAFADMKAKLGGAENLGFAERALSLYLKMLRRYSDQLMKESSEGGYRLLFDPKSAEVVWETFLVPKKGSSLARDIAARKPGTNTFAGLVTDESAAGFKLQLPLFAEEIREILTGAIEKGEEQAKDNVPPPAQPVVEELLKGLGRTVKSGEFDLAGAVNGPNKDGHFTAVFGVSYEDAGKLEKALKDAAKDAPKEAKDAIQFDVDKAGGVNIHKITPPQDAPAEAGKVFGANVGYVAFGEHGIYVTYGAGALDAIKKAVAAKPGPAKGLDVTVNPKRLQQLVAATNPQAGQMVGQVIGTDDKEHSVLFASVEGGDALRLRFGLSLKFLPRAAAGAAGMGGVQPAPAVEKD